MSKLFSKIASWTRPETQRSFCYSVSKWSLFLETDFVNMFEKKGFDVDILQKKA